MRGGRVSEKILRGGGDMSERVKKMKCGGGGYARRILKVGVCRRGYRRQNAGEVGLRKKKMRGMPERVKKTKCGGGVLREKFEGGYAGEGKEDEMRGVAGKNWGGGVDHTKKSRGGVSGKLCFFRGGVQILNGIAQCK